MRLDCGHEPTKYEDGRLSAGYGVSDDGTTFCDPCFDEHQRDRLTQVRHYTAYLDGDRLTTWTGCELAKITQRRTTRAGFGGTRVYFRARDVHGARWYGNSPGDGMYARMHRTTGGSDR